MHSPKASPFWSNHPPLARARVAGPRAGVAVATAKAWGADLSTLGEACGLGDLNRPLPDWISVQSYLALLEAASAQTRDPLFGLHVGERMRVTDASGYGIALLACSTFRETTDVTIRFESLCHDLGRSQLMEDGGKGCFRWHSPWRGMPGGRHLIESAAAYIRTVNNWLAGCVLPVDYFGFMHSRPPDADPGEYERVLGAEIRFDNDFDEGVFSVALIDFAIPNADRSALPDLIRILETRLNRQNNADAPAIEELRNLIRSQMLSGRVGLAALAAAKNTSPRTVQRRLMEAGVTYASLLDEVRKHAAQELLGRGMRFTEIALLLGFSEQSSFTHAFRRWFGMSPGKWRASSK